MPLFELTGDDGMVTALSQEEGGATATYRLSGDDDDTPPTPAEVGAWCDWFLGGVLNVAPVLCEVGDPNAGKIDRVLPPTHPWRPDLSVSAVTGIKAVSPRHAAETSLVIDELAPVTEQYPNGLAYDFQVRFSRRPFYMMPNDYVGYTEETYYRPAGGSGIPIVIANEWNRFTVTNRMPSPDTVSATSGTVLIRTQTGGATPPNGFPFPGQVSMYLQNEIIEIDWFMVPYRYLYDQVIEGFTYRSYLNRFLNHVNQNAWNGHAPGTLMYLGCNPTQFVPATPDRTLWEIGIGAATYQYQLCNVKLRFLKTTREGTDVPDSSSPLFDNKNNVGAGHNLVPNFEDRTFRYAAVTPPGGTDSNAKALNPSFPFGLFFTDPLLAQYEII